MKRNAVERYIYPAVFSYDSRESEISVVFPDLDVATSGEDEKDAFFSARELLQSALYGLEEDGAVIPAPTPLADVKLADNERAVLIDVYMPSVRQANNNKAISRTVTLPAYLDALAREHGLSYSQVLQDGIKSILHIER